jgi:shikimate dehydrogenase
MIKAGVIGHPISHSKSPLIHGYWLKQYGIEGEYKTYDIDPAALETGVRGLVDAGLVGFNVTLPHKQNIIPLCKTLSNDARSIGAVNTVTVLKNGDLHGHNTDAFGFARNLKVAVPDFDWENATATVIGAGGAARAILYALQQHGIINIRITNRTIESAQNLAALYQAKVIDWDDRNASVRDADLIINTTSLGMKGQNSLDIDLSGINGNAVVYDIVYTPLMTPLLQQAEEKHVRIVTGVGMLLHQARPGFEAWFGHFPDVTPELESLILGIK